MEKKYFSIAQPIEKVEFLKYYHKVSLLAKLIFAPIGIDEATQYAISKPSFLLSYTGIYQQIEDIVAKLIFRAAGIEDDVIAATNHQYVGHEQDKEVIKEMKIEEDVLKSIYDSPPVVIFDFPFANYDEIFNEESFKKLFNNVILALKNILKVSFNSSKFSNLIDEDINNIFGIKIPLSIPNPFIELNSLSNLKDFTEIKTLVDDLFNSFKIYVSKKKNIDALNDEIDSNEKVEVNLSYEQFIALYQSYHKTLTEDDLLPLKDLQIFSHPLALYIPHLSSIFSKYTSLETYEEQVLVEKEKKNKKSSKKKNKKIKKKNKGKSRAKEFELDENGNIIHNDETENLNDSENENLDESVEDDKNDTEEDENSEEEEDFESYDEEENENEDVTKEDDNETDEEPEYRTVEKFRLVYSDEAPDYVPIAATSLKFTKLALEKLNISEMLSKSHNYEEAVDELNDDLLEVIEEQEEHEDLGVILPNKIVIPVFLYTTLLFQRCKCNLKLGKIDQALYDIQHAIELNKYNAEAYTLRSQIVFESLQEGKANELIEFFEGNDISYFENQKGSLLEFFPEIQEENDFDDEEVPEEDQVNEIDYLLHQAAEDALLAFLLGGSYNVSLASTAQTAAKETCRKFSKKLYKNKYLKKLDFYLNNITLPPQFINNALPRSWLVKTYFSSYELLSSSLSIFGEYNIYNKLKDQNFRLEDDIDTSGNNSNNKFADNLPFPPDDLLSEGILKENDLEIFNILYESVSKIDNLVTDVDITKKNEKEIDDEKYNSSGLLKEVIYDISIENSNEPFAHEINNIDTATSSIVDYGTLISVDSIDLDQYLIKKQFDTSKLDSKFILESKIESLKIHSDNLISEEIRNIIIILNENSSKVLFKMRLDGSIESLDFDYDGIDYDCELEDINTEDLNENEGSENIEKSIKNLENISSSLMSRLLNLAGSISFLCGDSIGAIKCFESSIYFDNNLIDSYIKLASLFVDLDEVKKSSFLFDKIRNKLSKNNEFNSVFLLHNSQLEIHLNDFNKSIDYLSKAHSQILNNKYQFLFTKNVTSTPFYLKSMNNIHDISWIENQSEKCRRSMAHIHANIYSLWGINLFKNYSHNPSLSLMKFEDGLVSFPNSTILLLCYGEIHSQCGDLIRSIQSYKKILNYDAFHPLLWINCNRIYQQLDQLNNAKEHLLIAQNLDPTLSMTFIDYIQLNHYMNKNNKSEVDVDSDKIMNLFDQGIQLSKQVSEICDVLAARYVILIEKKLKVEFPGI